ncbi:MAG: hypothetical protein ACKO9F_08670 [Caldilinea sp.]
MHSSLVGGSLPHGYFRSSVLRAADRYGHRPPTLIGYGVLIGAALGRYSHSRWSTTIIMA